MLKSSTIDVVAVVTPVWTHYELTKAALENGKHVFVEKPFTSTPQQAEELIELAARKNLKIMVDHTFLFSGAVRKIREIIDSGTLGPLYYFDSTRVNLGLFQHDVSVVWDLAPHDLSIMDHIIGERPEAVVATGGSHLNGHADMAFITVYFPRNIIAHVNVNWLSPVKVRTTLIGGKDKMLVWNDLEADEKIKVYDRGVNITSGEGVYDLLVSYRSGDVWAPRCDQTEALKVELEYFLDCIDGESLAGQRRRGRAPHRPAAGCRRSLAGGSRPTRLALISHHARTGTRAPFPLINDTAPSCCSSATDSCQSVGARAVRRQVMTVTSRILVFLAVLLRGDACQRRGAPTVVRVLSC